MVADVIERAFQSLIDTLAIEGAEAALQNLAFSKKLLLHHKAAFHTAITNGRDTHDRPSRVAIVHSAITSMYLCCTEVVKGVSSKAANLLVVDASRALTGGLVFDKLLADCVEENKDYDDIINKHKLLLVPSLGNAVTEAVALNMAAKEHAQSLANLAAAASGSRSNYPQPGPVAKRPRTDMQDIKMTARDVDLIKDSNLCFRHVKNIVAGGEPCPNGARCNRSHDFDSNAKVTYALAKYGYQKQQK